MTLDYTKMHRWQDAVVKGHFFFRRGIMALKSMDLAPERGASFVLILRCGAYHDRKKQYQPRALPIMETLMKSARTDTDSL